MTFRVTVLICRSGKEIGPIVVTHVFTDSPRCLIADISAKRAEGTHGGLAVWSSGREESADSILTHALSLSLARALALSSPIRQRSSFLPLSPPHGSACPLLSPSHFLLRNRSSSSPASRDRGGETRRGGGERRARMSRDFSQTLASLPGRITYNYPKTRLHGAMGEAPLLRLLLLLLLLLPFFRSRSLCHRAQSPVHIGPLEADEMPIQPTTPRINEDRGGLLSCPLGIQRLELLSSPFRRMRWCARAGCCAMGD